MADTRKRMATMNTMNTASWKAKFTSAAPTAARGRISRGNATFETRLAFDTTDTDAVWVAVENSVQAMSPDSRYTAKFGMFAGRTYVKITKNTTRYSSGFSIDQTTPRAEDLYFTFSSLRTRFTRTSRWARSSRKRRTTWSLGGSLVRTKTSGSAAAGRTSVAT